MDYGSSDTSTTTLGANQFPISEVWVPNGTLTALEGGPSSTDAGGKKSAPASMYVKDGGDVTLGAKGDAAITDPAAASASVIALLRGLLTELIDIEAQTTLTPTVSGSVSVSNFPATQPVSGTFWQATQPVSGSVAQTTGASVALTAPPANTNANADTVLTFASQAKHFLIQNNTAANAYIMLDTASSLAGVVLVPGAIWRDDIPVTSPHVFTVAAQPINAANGLIFEGWL